MFFRTKDDLYAALSERVLPQLERFILQLDTRRMMQMLEATLYDGLRSLAADSQEFVTPHTHLSIEEVLRLVSISSERGQVRLDMDNLVQALFPYNARILPASAVEPPEVQWQTFDLGGPDHSAIQVRDANGQVLAALPHLNTQPRDPADRIRGMPHLGGVLDEQMLFTERDMRGEPVAPWVSQVLGTPPAVDVGDEVRNWRVPPSPSSPEEHVPHGGFEGRQGWVGDSNQGLLEALNGLQSGERSSGDQRLDAARYAVGQAVRVPRVASARETFMSGPDLGADGFIQEVVGRMTNGSPSRSALETLLDQLGESEKEELRELLGPPKGAPARPSPLEYRRKLDLDN